MSKVAAGGRVHPGRSCGFGGEGGKNGLSMGSRTRHAAERSRSRNRLRTRRAIGLHSTYPRGSRSDKPRGFARGELAGIPRCGLPTDFSSRNTSESAHELIIAAFCQSPKCSPAKGFADRRGPGGGSPLASPAAARSPVPQSARRPSGKREVPTADANAPSYLIHPL